MGTEISINKMTSKYVGKPFETCTCMNLAYNWYQDLGVSVPDSFGGLSLKNYFEAWKLDKKAVLNEMVKLFESLGTPVDLNDIQRHDLLAVSEAGNLYAAIALGNGMIITSHISVGVRVLKLGKIHQAVLARRLI